MVWNVRVRMKGVGMSCHIGRKNCHRLLRVNKKSDVRVLLCFESKPVRKKKLCEKYPHRVS